MSAKARLQTILANTVKKISSVEQILEDEYENLEQVPPAPGRPHEQHDQMVKQGLCKAAEDHVNWNRYCNQYPFDSHLVALKNVDYINASWIQMPLPASKKFVATIGPFKSEDLEVEGYPDICGDFWKMAFETGAKVIAMMCKVQRGFQGCSCYFPKKVGKSLTFDQLTVTLKEVEESEGFVMRKFEIKDEESKLSKEILFKISKVSPSPNYGNDS